MTNKSYKFRPPPARLFNSPPPTTKDQLGPPDSCTSLPLWLTQLGFSSFIFNPVLTLLLSYFQRTIHQASRPVAGPCFVSNSQRQFVVLAPQLHPSRRILVLEPLSGCWHPGRQARWHQTAQEVFRYFWPRTGNSRKITVIINQRRNSWTPFSIKTNKTNNQQDRNWFNTYLRRSL